MSDELDLSKLTAIRETQRGVKRGKPNGFFVVIDRTGEPCLEFQCVFCNRIHNLPIRNRDTQNGHHGFTMVGDINVPDTINVDERIKVLIHNNEQSLPKKCEFFLRNGEQILID